MKLKYILLFHEPALTMEFRTDCTDLGKMGGGGQWLFEYAQESPSLIFGNFIM